MGILFLILVLKGFPASVNRSGRGGKKSLSLFPKIHPVIGASGLAAAQWWEGGLPGKSRYTGYARSSALSTCPYPLNKCKVHCNV